MQPYFRGETSSSHAQVADKVADKQLLQPGAKPLWVKRFPVGSSSIPEGYGEYLVAMGRFDQGLQAMKRARALNPLSVVINADYCRVLGYARRYEDLIAACNEALEFTLVQIRFFNWRIWAAHEVFNGP
jgi:hypothetical protein